MPTNVDRFKKDLETLISTGDMLEISLRRVCFPQESDDAIQKQLGNDAAAWIKALPNFNQSYQGWYSESIVLIRQLLPDRLADFIRHYEKPRSRKELSNDNYRIEDFLQGLSASRAGLTIVALSAAVPHFQQQLAILKAARARFSSSLFEIRQLVQADLFDTELDAAEGLAKFNFYRAAGALAGVVLERHLAQVCKDRSVPGVKKNPTIGDFNEALKSAGAIDISNWRFIQHLTDIRNLCDHSKKPEPTAENCTDLITGVKKVIKTVH